jgi:hypothetical protein
LGENGVQDRVRDLVGHLVRMALETDSEVKRKSFAM